MTQRTSRWRRVQLPLSLGGRGGLRGSSWRRALRMNRLIGSTREALSYLCAGSAATQRSNRQPIADRIND
eukprot:6186070-Pleurochrysis_carterae.AAC.2